MNEEERTKGGGSRNRDEEREWISDFACSDSTCATRHQSRAARHARRIAQVFAASPPLWPANTIERLASDRPQFFCNSCVFAVVVVVVFCCCCWRWTTK